MAKKFNLADFVQPQRVSDPDTVAVTMIPWDRIRSNLDNFYAVDDVEELRNSIQMHGLLDPIVVAPEEDAGWYLLISGHRRHKAWGQLREEDPEKYAEIPAIVRTFESKAMAELALIMANSSARVLSPAEVGRQAERVERLFYELKEEGYEFPGRMRDQVARACQVSASKLARLKVIRDRLAHCWQTRWTENKLPEDTAYRLAQLPDWVQERIFTVNPQPMARGVEKVGAIMEAGNDYRCEDLSAPGCGRCSHGDAFLRHDLDDPWNACEGKTCCLKCEMAKREWSPCSRMCSKAKEKRSKALEKKKAKDAAERDAHYSELQRRIRESAIRLAAAADRYGAPDDGKIRTRYAVLTVGDVRALADGSKVDTSPYCNYLAPEEGLDVASAATALGCSADYVCGFDALPPEGDPEDEVYMATSRILDPDWMTGTPPGDGRYLCLVDMDRAGIPDDLHEQMLDLRDGVWLAYGRGIDDMFDVVGWWPLPRKWERWHGVPGEAKEAQDDDADA